MVVALRLVYRSGDRAARRGAGQAETAERRGGDEAWLSSLLAANSGDPAEPRRGHHRARRLVVGEALSLHLEDGSVEINNRLINFEF